MKTIEFRWTLLAMTMALVMSMMALTSCGDDEPDGDVSIVGQWKLSNINVLKDNNLDNMSSYFREIDDIVYEFHEDGKFTQYVHKHDKWYIAGLGFYRVSPKNNNIGTVYIEFFLNLQHDYIPIPYFNISNMNYVYYLKSNSLTLSAVVERIEMKFKPTSGITATEYNQ
ncbi:MAG: hypothetical protein IKT03_02005 [Muribaculaceae bacterium]|nr:hypothetical protein [Muribaculaceae bacterium]